MGFGTWLFDSYEKNKNTKTNAAQFCNEKKSPWPPVSSLMFLRTYQGMSGPHRIIPPQTPSSGRFLKSFRSEGSGKSVPGFKVQQRN